MRVYADIEMLKSLRVHTERVYVRRRTYRRARCEWAFSVHASHRLNLGVEWEREWRFYRRLYWDACLNFARQEDISTHSSIINSRVYWQVLSSGLSDEGYVVMMTYAGLLVVLVRELEPRKTVWERVFFQTDERVVNKSRRH